MLNKLSGGILVFRFSAPSNIEVFLLHPGGPFYYNKDVGVWSIPKGEIEESEDVFSAAKREFKEETGYEINGNFIELTPVFTKSKKKIYAWAVECGNVPENIISNSFQIEWPPNSGIQCSFPEMDKAKWFDISTAKNKIHNSQLPFLIELLDKFQLNSAERDSNTKTLFD
jgi:predicted NUDIX family NTP pyrophosphohydrolase